MPINQVVELWSTSEAILGGAEPYLFGAPVLKQGLQRAVMLFEHELDPRPPETIPVLFILSSGLAADMEFGSIFPRLQARNTNVITCIITNQRIPRAEARTLYSEPCTHWNELEQCLFQETSMMRPEFKEGMEQMFREQGWVVPPRARLFVRIYHHIILEEFMRVILSALGG